MNNFYTYIYYDPSRHNEPFYIGKGCNDRAWSHLGSNKHTPFVSRLKHMKKNNVKPVIGIYAGFDEELALLVEEELIAKFGRKDLGRGPLLNLTDGGEGTRTYIQSDTAKEKRSKALMGHRGYWKDKELSEQHKDKVSKSLLGRKKPTRTDEHKANLKIARNKRPPYSQEQKLKMAEAQKNSWAKRKSLKGKE